jgi:hypothetical protein
MTWTVLPVVERVRVLLHDSFPTRGSALMCHGRHQSNGLRALASSLQPLENGLVGRFCLVTDPIRGS